MLAGGSAWSQDEKENINRFPVQRIKINPLGSDSTRDMDFLDFSAFGVGQSNTMSDPRAADFFPFDKCFKNSVAVR